MPANNPALSGLQAASPEELIRQRMAVNQLMSGKQAPVPVPPVPRGQFQLNPQIPDPSSMLAALQKAGYTGQRTTDIDLGGEPDMDFDELMRRSNALLRPR